MLPTEERVQELRKRFGVQNGQFFSHYKYKNLNWYLAASETEAWNDEWFCFGDIQEEDVPRLQNALRDGEYLLLGWKDLTPNVSYEKIAGDGGSIWLVISPDKVLDAVELKRLGRR